MKFRRSRSELYTRIYFLLPFGGIKSCNPVTRDHEHRRYKMHGDRKSECEATNADRINYQGDDSNQLHWNAFIWKSGLIARIDYMQFKRSLKQEIYLIFPIWKAQ